jgi:hypothetical protein
MRGPRWSILGVAVLSLAACGGSSKNNDTSDAGMDAAPQPQCSDGVDNDGDGLIDFPYDPGCFTANQDDETDDCPTGPNCPQCANAQDDDMNGTSDYPDDPGCSAASDTDEYTDDPLACGAPVRIKQLPVDGHATGTLMGSTSNLQGACGGAGPEDVYELRIQHPKVVVATTNGSSADTVVYLRSAMCTDASMELACNDDASPGNLASTVNASIVQPGTYYLVVDSKNATGGAYDLHVQFLAGEGDACTTASECGPGLVCRVPLNGTTMVCAKHVCSDGVDDDADGKNDYPDDPGCTAADDDDETDDCPNGPNCPQCGNGSDDDNDGHTDYPADTSCQSASSTSESCQTHEGVSELTMPTTTGDTTTAVNDSEATCAYDTGGPDLTYQLDVPALSTLSVTIDTGSSFWYADLDLFDATCGGSELACDYSLTRTNVAAGTYYVVVDGDDSFSYGPFTLTVSGTITAGGSCESPLAQSGALTCTSGYACKGTMGSRTCQPAVCADGIDNDVDGHADYPMDPGCASPSDDDETDDCPSGPNCPVCGNGIDDDNDGHTDYPADNSCAAASSTSESCTTHEGVAALTMPTTTGDTTTATNDIEASCAFDIGGLDLTYQLDVPALRTLSVAIDTGSSFWYPDLELLDSSCGGSGIECDNDNTIERANVAAGTYYLVVDGDDSYEYGPYTLTVSGTIATGGSCESPLAQSGALTCEPGSACTGTMGSRVCAPRSCNDGIDNDGDGKIDYPFDPGCDSPDDDSETDPATPPVCSNSADDDGDSLTDFPGDYGCASAASTTEQFCAVEADPVMVITANPTTGTTSGLTNNFPTSSCQANANGLDQALALQLPVPVTTLVLDLSNTSYDSVITLRDATCGTELGCDDDSGTPTYRSKLTMSNVRAGNYAVVVDGYDTNSGTYTLSTKGTVAPGTACDSPLFNGGANAVLVCPTGTTCTGTPMTCQ